MFNIYSDLRSCAIFTGKAEHEDKTLVPFNPLRSRINSIYDNRTQRALAYSMYSSGAYSGYYATRLICELLYDKATNQTTVIRWFNNFKDDDSSKAQHKILDGSLTDFAKQALVVCEHDHRSKPTVKEAHKRINGLFGKGTVTEGFVQVTFEVSLFSYVQEKTGHGTEANGEAGNTKKTKKKS